MPTNEKKKSGSSTGFHIAGADSQGDEWRRGALSAYMDGELAGRDLETFEQLLKDDPALLRQIDEMRSIEAELMDLGAEILNEALPETMLATFSKILKG